MRGLEFFARKPERKQHVEIGIDKLRGRESKLHAELLAQRPLIECELEIEHVIAQLLDFVDLLIRKSFRLERCAIDMRATDERAVSLRILFDLLDLLFGISKLRERLVYGLIDDLEIPSTGKLLNFTMAKSGSMPVVSQSMTRPMVPVGAMTVTCALR